MQQSTNNFERVEVDGEVFYSIYSEYDGEIVHMSPEQVQEFQQWLVDNAATIREDVQTI